MYSRCFMKVALCGTVSALFMFQAGCSGNSLFGGKSSQSKGPSAAEGSADASESSSDGPILDRLQSLKEYVDSDMGNDEFDVDGYAIANLSDLLAGAIAAVEESADPNEMITLNFDEIEITLEQKAEGIEAFANFTQSFGENFQEAVSDTFNLQNGCPPGSPICRGQKPDRAPFSDEDYHRGVLYAYRTTRFVGGDEKTIAAVGQALMKETQGNNSPDARQRHKVGEVMTYITKTPVNFEGAKNYCHPDFRTCLVNKQATIK